MDYLPVFLKLHGHRCLVVGGGEVALRKVRLLRRAGARVTVVAPRLGSELAAAARAGDIDWLPDTFRPELLDDTRLVIAATDNRAANCEVARAAEAAGLWANTVDDGEAGGFIMPAIVDRSPLVVALSTGGGAPVLARQWRARLEALLPARLGALAELARSLRARVSELLPKTQRRGFWERLFSGPAARLVEAGRETEAREQAEGLLADIGKTAPAGRVTLVGAGPGAPDLLTLRGLQALHAADVIFHDCLVNNAILDLARRDARRIDVGKIPGRRGRTQAEINALLIDEARAGRHVVRLKGGDPFIFGRGGEELEALAAINIPFEVVPGITAATACAAYAGIPLTHRDHSQAVTFATAHCRRSVDRVDWRALAGARHTVAFYMGVRLLDRIAEKLIAHGRDPDTPVAIVENGSTDEQRILRGELRNLSALAARYALRSPALVIVGATARLTDELHWFGAAALHHGNDALAVSVTEAST